MTNIWQRFISSLSKKESQARMITSYQKVGQPIATPANFGGYTVEGYQKNAIVYKCISLIAQSSGGIEWTLYKKGRNKQKVEVEDHPLLDLINKPNPMQAKASFIEACVAYYQLTGNSYTEKTMVGSEVRELWPVRPDMMKIIAGENGYPLAYEFSCGGRSYKWPVSQTKFTSNIIHIRTFNPNNDWYGQSPLQAAILSLDQSNESNKLNLALLQNSANPSGVLQMKVTDGNGGALTQEQYDRMKKEFDAAYVGAMNNGRPLILEGGLEWKQVSLTPREMEFLEGRKMSSTELAMVYGVPPEMLGLGQKTYQNYAEARMAFYEETVLPCMDKFKDEFNRDLVPSFGDDSLCLEYDKDDIEALAPKREKVYSTVQNANWLTQNEKRVQTGFDEVDGMDVFVIGSQIIDPNAEDETDPNAEDENAPEDETEDMDETRPTPEGTAKKPKPAETPPQESDEKGFKAFNPINRNERKSSWKAQNAKRERLVSPFEKDLQKDFDELGKAMANSIRGVTDPRVAEFALTKAIGDHVSDIKKTLKRHIGYTMDAFGDMIFNEAKFVFQLKETKKNLRFEHHVEEYIEKRTGRAITTIEGTTKKQVQRIVKKLVEGNIADGNPNADLADELLEEFDALTKGRARTIARTEVMMASTNASLEAVKSLQIPNLKKEWISIQDDRVRDGSGPNPGVGANHEVMNGVKVDLDEKFVVPPDADMDGPGDESAGADQVCNCRCVLTYSQTQVGE